MDHYSLDVVIAVGYCVRTMYLDYAEDQAMRQRPMHMADWVTKLDGFLEFNERNVLTHAGSISADMARQQDYRLARSVGNRPLVRPMRKAVGTGPLPLTTISPRGTVSKASPTSAAVVTER